MKRMHTYLLLGTYSPMSVKDMSPERTHSVVGIVEGFNGQIVGVYALLGEYDLAVIANLPGNQEAMEASMALSQATGIFFTTMPAVGIEKYDEIIRRSQAKPPPKASDPSEWEGDPPPDALGSV